MACAKGKGEEAKERQRGRSSEPRASRALQKAGRASPARNGAPAEREAPGRRAEPRERPSHGEIDSVILHQRCRLLAQLRLFISKALARQLLNLTRSYTNVWVMLQLQKIRHFYLFVCLFIYHYGTYLSL